MKILKKLIILTVLFTAISAAYTVEIEIAAEAGNFAFSSDGVLKKMPDFGFRLILDEDLGKNIHGRLAVRRTPGFGNSIWGRIAYVTDSIKISIGPALGFLNSNKFEKDFITLFQPGFGTSMSFRTPKGFLAEVDTNFAVPLTPAKTSRIYLQDGFFELGWNFPNITASLKISQKTKTSVKDNDEIFISLTDMGMYTMVYSKPSRFRIPLNVFFRINRYEKRAGSLLKDSIGSVVLETGLEHTISSEVEWFVNFGAGLFSFSFEKKGEAVKGFFFNTDAGVRISVGS
ncbi:hypothetical protein [Treponema pedis]|uniref:Uncharacterized protein n=2 Tax=Treponema pedis TaxID=409322 RepID=S6A8C6_9SPIR|nr:hypothetical protein [Treponema pedis]AGT43594.1 hypothetical protein TPE_1098 [Treponema pedis str. T A4]QOW61124.1 hypothetical protein IFE08_01555 [Treponema pedis]QSI04383.1 hypothetical protein DYQ05_05245 [Treponema pedis]